MLRHLTEYPTCYCLQSRCNCCAVGDMDLLFMRTTRYESEDSSGMLCAFDQQVRSTLLCYKQGCCHITTPQSCWTCLMQALVAGTVCKWQMELACRCHYGPSDQAQGNEYTMTPKRYNDLHTHLQKAPLCTNSIIPQMQQWHSTIIISLVCLPERFTLYR